MRANETSQKNALFVFKYGFGCFLFIFGLLLFNREHPYASGCISAGFILVGIFFLSVARIKPDATALQYRVWFRWHTIPYSEIVACGESWVFGYVKARSFLRPWGKIYFARGYADDSLFGWDKKVISTVCKKAGIADTSTKG